LKEEVLNFQIPPLERSPSSQRCSSVSGEQNGYYAAQDFYVREFIKTESASAVQHTTECLACVEYNQM